VRRTAYRWLQIAVLLFLHALPYLNVTSHIALCTCGPARVCEVGRVARLGQPRVPAVGSERCTFLPSPL
jgi:hypothetical protein